MLGVRQWRHVALRHGAFCVSRQHRLLRWWLAHFMSYSWKAHVYSSMKQCLQRWITSYFPFRWQRTTNTTSGWKSSIFNRNSFGERRLKFIASEEDDDNKKPCAKHREHHLPQRRQRRQHSDPNMYRGSDKIIQLHCKWSRWREGIPTVDASKSDGEIRQRLQFTVKLSSPIQRYTICTMHVKNIFPTDRGQPISLYTMSSIGFYSNLYVTMNRL